MKKNHLSIIGLGLIGASLAKSLKEVDYPVHISAWDSNLNVLTEALKQGVIDEILPEISALEHSDIIILAIPVAAIAEFAPVLANLNLKKDVVISDVGSTKKSVVSAFINAFGEIPRNYIPAHPIAGRERSGLSASEAGLFKHHKVILCTNPHSDNRAIGIISRIWHACGAAVSYLDIDEHDEIFGATSHLPHVLAYLLVDMLAQDLHHQEIFNYAAGGFRDFTRIASSNPRMWRDISINNAEVLNALITQYQEKLEELKTLLQQRDGETLEALFQRAKDARDNHYNLG